MLPLSHPCFTPIFGATGIHLDGARPVVQAKRYAISTLVDRQ
jgi:hypothetical protein